MERLITYDTLRSFAYSNDRLCAGPIRGIVLSFFGLGGAEMFAEDTPDGIFFAERDILFVIPYSNPWAWMNRQTVAYTDEVIDVLMARYDLPETLPIVSTGGSMGGLSALVYAVYAKRTPAACVANCPVCDLVYHYKERPDLPRTLYSAFYSCEGTLEQALSTASPLHLADRLPRIPYRIFHCDRDKAVLIEKHSDPFVAELKGRGFDVTYHVVPDRGHCDLPDDMRWLFNQYCLDAVYAS